MVSGGGTLPPEVLRTIAKSMPSFATGVVGQGHVSVTGGWGDCISGGVSRPFNGGLGLGAWRAFRLAAATMLGGGRAAMGALVEHIAGCTEKICFPVRRSIAKVVL